MAHFKKITPWLKKFVKFADVQSVMLTLMEINCFSKNHLATMKKDFHARLGRYGIWHFPNV